MNKINQYERRSNYVPMLNPRVCGIYKITCIPNGRVYIGSSINIHSRWEKHQCGLNTQKHYNKHLLSAYNKYGKDNFLWEIIEECDRDVLWDREQHYLDVLQPFDEKGFNTARVVKAPMTGRKHSPEDREKMSRVQRAMKRKCPEERKKYLSELFKGRKRSKEAIEQGTAKLRGQPKSPQARAAISRAGSTPEAIKDKKDRMERVWEERRRGRDCYLCFVALYAIHHGLELPKPKGKPHTEEAKRKITEANLRLWGNPEYKQRRLLAQKKG